MTGIHDWFDILIPLLYVVTWANYTLLFFRDTPAARRTATPLLLGTATLHWAAVVLTAMTHRRCPLGNLPEVLSVLALSVVVVYLVLERRQRNKYSGMFLLALVIPIMIVSSAVTPALQKPSLLLKSPLFGLHTTMAILGYAAFLVCTVYGVMYLLLHHALKARTFGLVFHRLPSLDGLANMAVTGALIGFLALSATIIIGVIWGSHALDRSLLPNGLWGDPKIMLTLLVWAAYGLGLGARFILRWANRSTMWLFLTAFVVAVLAVVALNTILTTFHNFTTTT
jgi:ABC-type transport system involved in cytochrome c biogenesis permease subunit